jgi:flagellar basal body-associated protein FliL
MSNQDENEGISKENRNMWIAVGVIVVLLAGGMGVNMLVHHDTGTGEAQTSSPSTSSPSQ